MKIGITGHQERDGIDWSWVKQAILTELESVGEVDGALSSLAAGTDQVFAEAALSIGILVTAVIPLDGYDQFFEGSDRERYWRILAQSKPVHLQGSGPPRPKGLVALAIS